MRHTTRILALYLSLCLCSAGVIAGPATEIEGSVTAKRSGELKAAYTATGKAAPKPGDKVDFIFRFQGIDIDAGRGEVSEAGENFVWVRILAGRPDLKHVALIHATGTAPPVTPVPPQRPPQPPQPTEADTGWGASGVYQQIDPAQRYLNEIAAAHQRCDHRRAYQITQQALQELPDNDWLKQNHSTLKTLSDRDESYRQALEGAYRKLEKSDVNGSIELMKTAMRNASVECGQDQQVRSLLEQARQMAQMEREAAIEAARRRGLENARSSQSYRAEIEKKRADREAFGQALTGNLLGLLGLFNAGDNSAYPPTEPDSDQEMVNRLVNDTQQNNSEMLNRWRESQGWSTQPAASPQAPTTPPSGSGQTMPADEGWISDQVQQIEQNNSETLNRWRQSEGWE